MVAALGFAWTPPDNPDPLQILNEARSDADAGRYEEALAKQVWFHENALKYRPDSAGVRLSIALSAWAKLGQAYPPALAKLKAIRDETGKRVREADKLEQVLAQFIDFASINRTLGEEQKTTDLFVWLGTNRADAVKVCFAIAEPALIRAKKYRLCGKYIEPDRDFEMMRHEYRMQLQFVRDRKVGKNLQDFAEKRFANQAATLVALLVLNGRNEDAARIDGAAAKEWDDASFKRELEAARTGVVPEPWP
jgi:hypothetical protein